MATPEDKYYDIMNILLAPVRWMKSIALTLLLILLAVGIGLLYPLILYFNGQPVTYGSFSIPFLTLLAIVTFFYTPYYFIFGGLITAAAFIFGVCAYPDFMDACNFNGWGFAWLIFGFLAFGILQKFVLKRFDFTDLWNLLTGKTRREKERRKLNEQNRRDFEEQRRQRRQERERKRREEQAAFEQEHSDLLNQMRELVSSCRQPLDDVIRGASVLSGYDLVNADEAIMMDLYQIWRRLERTNGQFFADAPERLYKALCCVVEPKLIRARDWETTMCDLYPTFARQNVASPLALPHAVSMLSLYDIHAGTRLASKAALTYRSVLFSMAALRKESIAVKMLLDEYLKMLKPYIQDGDTEGAGFSNKGAATVKCERCANGYRLLDLPYGASHGEVNSKRLALSEVLHPDKLGDKSERARNAAEQQLKSINEVCGHMFQCTASS